MTYWTVTARKDTVYSSDFELEFKVVGHNIDDALTAAKNYLLATEEDPFRITSIKQKH